MRALIDSDVIRMEIGSVGQVKDEEGNVVMRSWDFVEELIDNRIREICTLTWADEKPLLFLTSCQRTHSILHRKKDVQFEPNFREAIAVTKPYKGTRKSEKPLHYNNITAYLLNCYDCVIAEGHEADDLLAVYQMEALRKGEETIICTRDKDLRMVPGQQFGWTCGKQEQYGPRVVSPDEGFKTFCMQLLTGDTVDNIPGLPGVGPVKASNILSNATAQEDMLKAVRDAYRSSYGDEWPMHLLEQGQLLWMCTELKEGKPVLWTIPDYLLEEDTHERPS